MKALQDPGENDLRNNEVVYKAIMKVVVKTKKSLLQNTPNTESCLLKIGFYNILHERSLGDMP